MGENIWFGDGCSPEEIKKGVTEFMNDKYQGLGKNIVYVNPAYKIGPFYNLSKNCTKFCVESEVRTALELLRNTVHREHICSAISVGDRSNCISSVHSITHHRHNV